MNPAAFHSAYKLKLDAKHRLFIPADVRRLMDPEVYGSAFFVILGPNKKPWFYPEKYYRTQASEMPREMTPNKDLLAYHQFKFAMADRLEWDEQGRVVMPVSVLERCEMQNEVTLTGVWDHLELWNRGDWDRYSEELVKNSAEIEAKGMAAMRQAQEQLEKHKSRRD